MNDVKDKQGGSINTVSTREQRRATLLAQFSPRKSPDFMAILAKWHTYNTRIFFSFLECKLLEEQN